MANNNDGQIVVGLDIPKSVSQINADIKKLEKQLAQVKATGALDTSATVKQINAQIAKLQAQLKTIDIKANVDTKNVQKTGEQIGNNIAQGVSKGVDKATKQLNKIQLSSDFSDLETKYKRFGMVSQEVETNLKELKSAHDAVINAKGTDRLATEIEKYDTALDKAKASLHELTTTQVSMNQRTSQMTTMQEWMRKNQKATKLCGDQVQKLIRECQTCDKVRFDQIKNEFKELQVEAGKAGKLGNTLFGGIIEEGKKFIQWTGVTGVVMGISNEIRQAATELKGLDSILTEISKTSDLTKDQLRELGDTSFESASKLGRTATDYLTSIQEMSRSGFVGEQAEGMAEQSLLAQTAGDLDKELANTYILATNAAYKFNGSAKELNKVLDGQNSITNRNSVAMADMATAMSEAGTVASSYRVSVEDLSAMIGTIESVTKLGGSEVGNAIKAILINLQNVNSSKIVETLDAANASMTEMVNGTEKLRDPISILRDLAKTFNELDEDDPLRAEILTNIGQKYHATKLGALLQNMEMYDKMLIDYAEGEGSAFEEAQKSANNLTGSINKLSNSWTEFVNTLVQSDDLKKGVNLLNDLVQGATDLVNVLTPLGTIGLLGGAGLGLKNIGRPKMFGLVLKYADNHKCSLGY